MICGFLRHQKRIKAFSVAIVCILLVSISGCDEKKENESKSSIPHGDITNLDDTGVVVKEYTPDSGTWKKLTYNTMPDLVEDAKTRLPELVNVMGYDFVVSKAYYNIWVTADNGTGIQYKPRLDEEVPYEILEGADWAVYDGEDIHLEYNIAGRTEIYYPGTAEEYYQPDEKNDELLNLRLTGTTVGEFDLEKNPEFLDKVYHVGNIDQSIGEASKRMLFYLDKAPREINPGIFEHVNGKVTVKRFGEDRYSYLFRYQLIYDGVPLISEGGHHDTRFVKENIEQYDYIKTVVPVGYYLGTYSDNGCDYVWTETRTIYKPEIVELGKEVMSYDKAKKIVSEFLSQNHVFTVDEAVLQYAMIQEAETKITEETVNGGVNVVSILPVWKFTISNLNVGDRTFLYVYILTTTGEVTLEYV